MNSFPSCCLSELCFAATTIFSHLVEYDASHRALTWLESKNCVEGAKDALTWAARTYVVAARVILYYVSIYMGGGTED
jgi:Zn-dependent membrane protease YugP